MTAATAHLPPELSGYLKTINPPEAEVLQRLRQATEQYRMGKMHLAAEQAQLLAFLVRLIGAKRCLEIGVYTGYSSTAVALALPADGTITACDINLTYTGLARQFWREAGVEHKIQLHLQPALITLNQLIEQGQSGSYDFALIDADKPPTAHYYERCLTLLRPGGLIAIDNLLLGGRVYQATNAPEPESIARIRAFNQSLQTDPRVAALTLPLGDGLTLLRKRHPEERECP
ncbi:class I SAM-dependent methyltransferase [Eikenella sp. S3360]|uniref:Class I SAM-dependent methyltransferase n=1 Tax=Eikenella glucosivorans TaxID=2766967 RepID=A0ABS0NDH9_9NEIS|nr:class I SAM-dependent methyltransferase [Eikenella glucosivorans]MBH5330360.1 class I SAM-dependent methyltransferase [Eikenella glucosivorans]